MEEEKRAVALNYNNTGDSAPKVLTKACGNLADFLIEKALENGITVIEDEELVSMLYELPEGLEIPEELYKAVADIYIFLYKANKKLRNIG